MEEADPSGVGTNEGSDALTSRGGVSASAPNRGAPIAPHPATITPTPIPRAPAMSDVAGEASSPGRGGDSDGSVGRAKELVRQITASRGAPDAKLLHKLAYILEVEESKCHIGQPSTGVRSTIGRLVNLVRDDEELYELISSTILLETAHPIGRKAAAMRLLLACLSRCVPTPNLVDDAVLTKLKEWAAEESSELLAAAERGSAAGVIACEGGSSRRRVTRGKEEHGKPKAVEEDISRGGQLSENAMAREMLRTYATGLLAVLTQSEDVVDDVVRTGMVGSLMRFLRVHVLRDEGGGKERVRSSTAAEPGQSSAQHRERERESTTPGETRGRSRMAGDAVQEDGRPGREDVSRSSREDVRSRIRIQQESSQRDEGRALELAERDRPSERPQREVSTEVKLESMPREGKEVIVGEQGSVEDALESWSGREIPAYDGDDEDDQDGWLDGRLRGKDSRERRDKGRVSLLKELNRLNHVGEIRRLREDDESLERPGSSRPLRAVEARERGARSVSWVSPPGRERVVLGEDREHGEVTGVSGDKETDDLRPGRSDAGEAGVTKDAGGAAHGALLELRTAAEAVGISNARDTEMKDVEGTGGGGGEGKGEATERDKEAASMDSGAVDSQQAGDDAAHGIRGQSEVEKGNKALDLSDVIARAARAAEAEARMAGAPSEVVTTVMEAARESARQAYAEAKASGKTEEDACKAAQAVATAIRNAAETASAFRKRMSRDDSVKDISKDQAEPSSQNGDGDGDRKEWALDVPKLLALKERFCVQCLAAMGEYLEVLGPVLHEKGLDVCLALLKRKPKDPNNIEEVAMVSDVLKLVCALAAHRKFAQLFVDRGGVQLLLAVPRVPDTYNGISLSLFAVASIQGVMERVCALPASVTAEVTSLALFLLSCTCDAARKNAALFFGASFVFRAIVDAFDAQDGLRRVLNLLRAALAQSMATGSVNGGSTGTATPMGGPHGSLLGSVGGGGNLGIQGGAGMPWNLPFGGGSGLPVGSFGRMPGRMPEMLTPSGKQIAFHTCAAIRQYFRTQLVLLVDSLKQSISRGHKGERGPLGSRGGAGRAAYKAVDISNEVIDGIIAQLQRDRRLGPAFVRASWPALQKFKDCGGHVLMLELTQLHLQAGPRYFHEIAQYALGVLHIITLMPSSHRAVLDVDGSMLSNDKNGMAVILDAASGASQQANADPEIIQMALFVLINLVCPPPSLCSRGGQNPSAAQAAAGQATVANGSVSMMVASTASGNGPLLASNGGVAAAGSQASFPSTMAGGVTAPVVQGAGGELAKEKSTGVMIEGLREKVSGERPGGPALASAIGVGCVQGLVGDRRISLGPGAGGSGMAAYMEQQYKCAREAVRANNGIKVLLMLLNQRLSSLPTTLDCVRALACRVLLGLARDPTIAHILTKLQVGRMLTELTKDSRGPWGRQAGGGGGEQNKWPQEFNRVALELIAITTDKPSAGRVTTAAASEAAAPTLRKIEKAAIAAATPILYNSRELLQLIHEHLAASGLSKAASALLEESGITPLPAAAPQVGGSICPQTACSQAVYPAGLARPFVSAGTSPQPAITWPGDRVPKGFMVGLAEGGKEGERTGPNGQGRWVSGGPGLQHGQSKGKRGLGARVSLKTASGGGIVAKKLGMQTGPASQFAEGQSGEKEGKGGGGFGGVSGGGETSQSSSFCRMVPLKRPSSTPLSPRCIPPPPQWGVGSGTATSSSATASAMSTGPSARAQAAPPGAASLAGNQTGGANGPVSAALQHVHATPPPSRYNMPMTSARTDHQLNTHSPYMLSSPVTIQQQGAFWHHPLGTKAAEMGGEDGVNSNGVAGGGATVRGGSALDSIVTQYLKHQHRQCPSPITTLPPLSLLYPHFCPEPRRLLDAPYNITRRVRLRQQLAPYGGAYGKKHDRHFVFSRFRPWRTCRDEGAQFTSVTFLGRSKLAVGSRMGDIRLFDATTGGLLETHSFHETGVLLLQSAPRGGWGWGWGGGIVEPYDDGDLGPRMLLLSSSKTEVKIWDPSNLESGPLHKFEDCRNGRFNPAATRVVAVDNNHRQVKIFDVQTGKEEQILRESPLTPGLSSDRGSYGRYANAYFSPADNLTLCCGVLWDYRIPKAVHKFDQFTDYGGGAFHPGGNEAIINSEVWDLRTFKLLKSVPALDGTAITFNSTGEVIYAILRRYTDGFAEVFHPRRAKNPLFAAFRTIDASDYSEISMVSVDRCVWDLAVEPTDSHIAVVMMDELKEMDSFARLYEVGRRRPTEGDSDPDDGADTEDEDESEGDEDEDDDDDLHPDVEIDLLSNEDGSAEEVEREEAEGMFSEERTDPDEEDEDAMSEDERGDPAFRGMMSDGDEDEGDGIGDSSDAPSGYSTDEEGVGEGFNFLHDGYL